MKAKLISITKPYIEEIDTAENLVVYIARVSNPTNQMNFKTSEKLLSYMIKNKHWSPFEMANMTIEVETSLNISRQILRHRSFSFQEFSQRYSKVSEFENIELRYESELNRQSSEVVCTDEKLHIEVNQMLCNIMYNYEKLINAGFSRETVRGLLPGVTKTKMYINGNIRSWIHYLQQRLDKYSQKEHRLLAKEIELIFKQNFPIIHKIVFEEN